MPETYRAIQAKAGKIGNEAYALVKRGLRGEPNCFWASERGMVMGTPFTHVQGAGWIADQIRQFGCLHVCTFPLLPSEVTDGTH